MRLTKTDVGYVREAQSILEKYGVSRQYGFLLECADELPSKYYEWESLGANLTRLLCTQGIRSAIGRLPQIDAGDLLNDNSLLIRAKMLVSMITQSYVFGSPQPVGRLPAQLARPLCHLSEALGVPPIMSYSDYVLCNWRLNDGSAPVCLDNLHVRMGMYGGTDEAWFMLIHVAVEAQAGELLASCVEARLAAESNDVDAVASRLQSIATNMQRLRVTFLRMRERCNSIVYFLRVRPFTHGWYNNPALSEGMVYEGVAKYAGTPQSFRGETGAQSSVIPAVDATLGIEHPSDSLNRHLIAMREYMPAMHRRFLQWTESSPIAGLVSKVSHLVDHDNPDLKAVKLIASYNNCVKQLIEFRNLHLKIAHEYVCAHKASKIDSDANPAGVGTGGTPPIEYLRHHRDATLRSIIEAPGRKFS